ncbi:MAG: hypothetical protein PHO74_01590 [Weeksellaceae bacterium]|jgi:hypothetical protein|nr:hypothetical protein [Weeksellaceae bacterium]
MNEEVQNIIRESIYGFHWILIGAVGILLLYLVLRSFMERKNK